MRIKIGIPDTGYLYAAKLPVRISDINYGNHTSNDAIVRLMHEARLMWLTGLGYTELNIEGVGLIMAGLAVEFKKESFYGDQLEIILYCSDLGQKGFDLVYLIRRSHDNNNSVIARAKTNMVAFDYNLKSIVHLPEKLAGILGTAMR